MQLRATRLTAIAHAVRRLFSPASLFAAGEPGVWYDPSDMSTMFQDAAGTTPVTAVEQPVGRILDKSGRGNHATQSTATSRPVLSARINKLLATATLSTQSVTTRATPHTLRFEGAGSVTLSGTAMGVYTAGSHSFTPTAGTLTLTIIGSVTFADLRETNEGVGLPVYQAVVTATNYDASAGRLGLRFDGVDDSLVTPTITPGTDKSQIFAGVRKLSDVVVGCLIETSVNSFSNNGAFFVGAPFNTGVANYGFRSRGTSEAILATTASFASPVTSVLTALGDIAGDSAIVRVDGVQRSTSATDQGTGNYLAYPLYIGRRNQASLPFNGNIHSLIVRFGPTLTEAQITQTEQWVNGKTGAY